MKRLSIIVPAYNMELYIEKCIYSLLAQNISLDVYEIIVVNDGSTDNTSTIVRNLCDKYVNIQLINQINMGLSTARNTALTYAKGDFVWFVDADDYIETDVLSQMLISAEENNLEIYAFELKKVLDDNTFIGVECIQDLLHNKILTGRSAMLAGYKPGSVCAYLLKKDFLVKNKLQFFPNLYHQDVEFTLRAICFAERICFTNCRPYNYLMRIGSIRNSINFAKKKKYLLDDIIVANSFLLFSERFKMRDMQVYYTILQWAHSILWGVVFNLVTHRNDYDYEFVKKIIGVLKEKKYYPLKPPFCTFKQELVSVLLNRQWFLFLFSRLNRFVFLNNYK